MIWQPLDRPEVVPKFQGVLPASGEENGIDQKSLCPHDSKPTAVFQAAAGNYIKK